MCEVIKMTGKDRWLK